MSYKRVFTFLTTEILDNRYHPSKKEGFLGMPEICLPIFREKKIGTSVTAIVSPIYSAALSPPPIRPMVEQYLYFEVPAIKNRMQNLIEECA